MGQNLTPSNIEALRLKMVDVCGSRLRKNVDPYLCMFSPQIDKRQVHNFIKNILGSNLNECLLSIYRANLKAQP